MAKGLIQNAEPLCAGASIEVSLLEMELLFDSSWWTLRMKLLHDYSNP